MLVLDPRASCSCCDGPGPPASAHPTLTTRCCVPSYTLAMHAASASLDEAMDALGLGDAPVDEVAPEQVEGDVDVNGVEGEGGDEGEGGGTFGF